MPPDIILTEPCAATVGRKSDAKMTILEQYADDHGSPLIDIVDECFYTAYLSQIARAGKTRVTLIELNQYTPKYVEWW